MERKRFTPRTPREKENHAAGAARKTNNPLNPTNPRTKKPFERSEKQTSLCMKNERSINANSPLVDMKTLNQKLPGKESQNTEFKSVWKDEYLKQICGFANANGGELFVGINDKGKVVGVQNTKKLLEDVPNKTVSLLGITVNVSQLSHDKLNYLVIEVMGSSVPISYRGKYFIRSGSTTQELKGHELRAFILQKDNITWDEITISKATKNDLDENVVFRFIKSAIDKNRLPLHAEKDNVVLTLKNLDLITDKNELTRAAILLFGKRPQKFVRSAIVKIGRFGNSDTELISQDTIEGNLLEMPDKVMELLRIKYLKSNISYQGIQRIEKLEYPKAVLREIVLNAIIHRDYGEQTDITIKVFDDKIVFWNSGELLPPLNIQMLQQSHPSKRRNALIANVFFRMGYIEAWGRGFLLIREELEKENFRLPEIVEFANGLQVTLFKNPKSKEKSKEKILQIIIENPNTTTYELSDITGLSISGIEKIIRGLKKQGLICRIGPARGGHWEVVKK